MKRIKFVPIAFACIILSGCATWSAGTVQQSSQQLTIATQPTNAENIALMEGDTKRKYVSLGDITVTVNKTTVFNQEPTREQVNEALKEKAAKMGANAVILVRYGDGGVSFFSWGSLEGKGRAIKYQP